MGRATNTANQSRSAPLQVPGSNSAGRVISGTWRFSSAPGGLPRRLLPPSGVGSSPGASNKGNADGPIEIFGNAGRVWAMALRSNPPKKALCHTCPLGEAVMKYSRSLSVLSKQYETSYLFYVTLSFLCNIICYQISVFAFSLVTFSRATTVYLWFQEGFKADSCNTLSTFEDGLLEWQLLALLSMCFSINSFSLLTAILIKIVYVQPTFWFYWFDLGFSLVILFRMC